MSYRSRQVVFRIRTDMRDSVAAASRAPTLRSVRCLLNLVTLAGLAGCVPANPPKVAVQPASVGAGTILSMRAVDAHADMEPLRAALLAGGGNPDDGGRPLLEFIVRADDGATLSIVQTNEPGFRKGDRVIILRDDQTRLARPG
jgi:outer membrane lipoprotein SlyB